MNTYILNQKGFVFILVSILMVTFGIQSSYAQEANPTITASVEASLSEQTLSGSVVTLSLSGGAFERSTSRVRGGVAVSGIEGVTVGYSDVDRVSDTKVTVELTFSGNIDTDMNLVFTVRAGAIAGYTGDALTVQVPVTAVEESLVATTAAPLTEATLHGSVVTLTLSGRSFDSSRYDIERAIKISGIAGVVVDDVIRISNTKANVELTFSGNVDADSPLTLTVGAGAIDNYNQAFTVQLPITAVAESLVATTAAPLTEANLSGSVVTVTLTGRAFDSSRYDIERALTISGIDGIAASSVRRLSNTKVTLALTFSGNIDTDATLTLTVGANAIIGYNEGFTVQLPVTAVAESLVATTAAPLTEATLHGSVVTLTLNGRIYNTRGTVLVSGIEGVSISRGSVDRVSDTQVTFRLAFSGNIDADSTLTITVNAELIVGYNEGFTLQLPVTAVAESLVATTAAPLTEANLSGSVVTLTLTGRSFVRSEYDIRRALTVSGVEGVTIVSGSYIDRVSATKVTVPLIFSGNIDADTTLTLTVGADAIVGYNEGFTVQLPVTAVAESLVATTEAPLTEANLSGSVVTLTLSGRAFDSSRYDIERALTISGIDGIAASSVRRLSNTKVTLALTFSGNIDTDATLTLTVDANVIVGYNEGFTVQLPVTAVAESLVATTAVPLTEANLSGSVVTLTLTERAFVRSEYDIRRALTVSGVEGVTIVSGSYIDRVSATKVTVPLIFSGNIDADTTLTLTVGANAIVGYNQSFSFEFPVTAVTESLVATTEVPLTEANLSGSVVTLTLTGRAFDSSSYDIERALTISGIDGVTVYDVDRNSNTEATVDIRFSGNIDTDATLTLTVGANAITGYNEAFTIQVPVMAVAESLVATTETPLTETALSGSVVTLTLTGRSFNTSGIVSVSGIDGVTISRVRRVSNIQMTVSLAFSGNIDADSTLTFTVSADRVVGYNEGFTIQLPVTAVAESLVATTAVPLTEANLSGSVVTLTLNGRSFVRYSSDIARVSVISGIEGVTGSVRRVSNTEATITLGFSGNINVDATLTMTIGADAIAGYNEGFSFELPVTAVAESLVATTVAPLTEANLSGSAVTLTLTGRAFVGSEYDIRRALTVSGVEGVTIVSGSYIDRVSATKVTVPLIFSGNIDTDATLTLTVGADAIVGYNEGFTVQLPVTAVAESLVATTEAPLTEANLSGSVVTLTLTGRAFVRSEYDIRRALTVSGVEGVTIVSGSYIDRVSATKVTVPLIFSGNIDTDATLTLTLGADAIVGYNEGFTVQLPVTAVEESLVATTEAPLTEANLSGSVVTLTLSGRAFDSSRYDIERALTISGIDGIAASSVRRLSNTKVTLALTFSGNIDTDVTLTLTVDANVIVGYNEGFTVQLPVTAVAESLVATTEAPLTEANLSGSVVTLTLTGRAFVRSEYDIRRALTVSGVEGVTIVSGSYIDRVSATKVTVPLIFSGNIDTDATLILTVGADAIVGYNEEFTVQLPVTAVEESLVASTVAPLTELTLSGSVVTLKLSGRSFNRESDITNALTVTGIEGVLVSRWGVDRVSNTEAKVTLVSTVDFDTDGVLTMTVGADAIVGYNKGFSFEFPVTAVEESLIAITEEPLSEATLSGSVVTLTLSGRSFTDEWDIADALTFSGIEGISVPRDDVERVSNTEAKVSLLFAGNIDTDGIFTLEVGADAISSYNEGFSFEFPVTAVEESLVVSTQTPLTEATLYGNSVVLTLNGRNFTWWTKDVQDAVTVSGIEGVTVGNEGFYSDDDSQVAVPLFFSGNIDEDATLTLTVEAGAIAGYDAVFTTEFSVPAVQESLDISSKFDLTEATLGGSEVILTLSGRPYVRSAFDIRDGVSVTGIEGVTVGQYDVDRVSNNQVTVELSFDGTDFDTDGTLTFTVSADAIAGYGEPFTAQIPVTAIKQSSATINISPNPIVSPPLSEQLTFSINIISGKDVAGFQAVVWYDNETLKYVESTKGNYLRADAFFVAPTVQEYEYYRYPYVPISVTALDGVSNGNGTLATLTFEVYNDVKESEITLANVYIVDREGIRWEVEIEGSKVTEPGHDVVGDINRDGIVDIRDLVLAGNRFGPSGENRADINGDGIIDIADLVLVANAFGADAAAPSLYPQVLEQLTAADIKEWLNQARQLPLTDPAYLRGITVLKQLLMVLTPKETVLLANYPNPFNPETWIPYHLAKDADVTLRIYAVNGTLVRTLALGHQPAGMYQNRSRAAYWDGKNAFGEPVASGVYFYTLTAGDFTATRKMLIQK